MSINHILKDIVPDDEKLDVQFKDVYCENIYSTNPPDPPTPPVEGSIYHRVYQQFTPVSISGASPITIFNKTSAIGTNYLQNYSIGTRYEFMATGDYTTGGVANKEVTIAIKVGSLVVFSITMTIPTTVGGHKMTGYLLTEATGVAGVAKLSGSLTHTFNSSTGTTTAYTSNFINDTTYSTSDAFLGIDANWGDTDPHSIEFRDFKLDKVG